MSTSSTVAVQPAENGIDRLAKESFRSLRHLSLGVLCHGASRTLEGTHLLDALTDFKVVRIFTPEHGIESTVPAGAHVADSKRGVIPVVSLYGKKLRPDPVDLKGLDLLVIDLQDVGVRCYTYLSTMLYALEAAAAQRLPVMLLDRINPIGGTMAEGPSLDPNFRSFLAPLDVPFRHGMTFGELALLALRSGELAHSQKLSLQIMKCSEWRRSMVFEESGRKWVNPSPALQDSTAALLYPGLVLFEATALSEGRGTLRSFRMIGAPWLDPQRIIAKIGACPGVSLTACEFTPPADVQVKFSGLSCRGLAIEVTNPVSLRSFEFGLRLLRACFAIHETEMAFDPQWFHKLCGVSLEGVVRQSNHEFEENIARWELNNRNFRCGFQSKFLYPD